MKLIVFTAHSLGGGTLIRSVISAPGQQRCSRWETSANPSDAGWGIDRKADLSAALQLQIRHTDTEMVETPPQWGGQFKGSFIPLSENFMQP